MAAYGLDLQAAAAACSRTQTAAVQSAAQKSLQLPPALKSLQDALIMCWAQKHQSRGAKAHSLITICLHFHAACMATMVMARPAAG
jgi:hypothetical protein